MKKSHFVMSVIVDKLSGQNLELPIGSSLANFLYGPCSRSIPVLFGIDTKLTIFLFLLPMSSSLC